MKGALHFGPEAIKLVDGEEKAAMLELIRAEGQKVLPHKQNIVGSKLVGRKRGMKTYELALENGARYYICNKRRSPVLLPLVKHRVIGWRYIPELAYIRGHEALMYFDKRKQGNKLVRMLRTVFARLPFHEALGFEPVVVFRAPLSIVKLFAEPTQK